MKDSIPFENNKKQVAHLSGKLTIKDLVKMGVTVQFAHKGEPLPDGWWRSCDEKLVPTYMAPTCCRKHWEKEHKKKAVGNDGVLLNPMGMPFIVCKVCGNKRCPKATNCALKCTGSNKPGQPGSVFGK